MGLAVDLGAEAQELVHAEEVVVDAVPRRVGEGLPPVPRADAVPEVIAADEVAARAAQRRRRQPAAQLQHVRVEPAHVVGRQQHDLVDPDRAGAFHLDAEVHRLQRL
ncbi:MAG: hypothetical protein H6644_03555 [Caldilineaceae bacterium]|nr:hypothetical protein [Caldilineaceae bacterium]